MNRVQRSGKERRITGVVKQLLPEVLIGPNKRRQIERRNQITADQLEEFLFSIRANGELDMDNAIAILDFINRKDRNEPLQKP